MAKARFTRSVIFSTLVLFIVPFVIATTHEQTVNAKDTRKWVEIMAKDKYERSAIANLGVAIEKVGSDRIWGFADTEAVEQLTDPTSTLVVNDISEPQVGRGGHGYLGGLPSQFPSGDEKYHTYDELKAALKLMQGTNADISRVVEIGKSHEGRSLLAININFTPSELKSGKSAKPGIVFVGTHHAREHLSTEVPLLLAKHLLDNRQSLEGTLKNRDIWIVPMLNPDGVEHDIKGRRYKLWRKNRRDFGSGTFGVDLNRNYSHKWGTGGSSSRTSSDTYRGPSPFSEPETQAFRDLVAARTNIKILLSYHTFSELILYPWGYTYSSVSKTDDKKVFETMAQKMATWTKYTPQQASDLYIASGVTDDWAYGDHGIFSFTFELSPKSGFWGSGFYPGPAAIDKVFAVNLPAALYLIGLADNPYKVITTRPSGMLRHFVQPR